MTISLLVLLLVLVGADLYYNLREEKEIARRLDEILGRLATISAGVSSQRSDLVRIDDNLRAARLSLGQLETSNEALPSAILAVKGEFARAIERLEEKQDIPEIRTPSQREALMRVASVRATLEANEEASYQEWLSRAAGKRSES